MLSDGDLREVVREFLASPDSMMARMSHMSHEELVILTMQIMAWCGDSRAMFRTVFDATEDPSITLAHTCRTGSGHWDVSGAVWMQSMSAFGE
jgi:hypothetical protein